MLARFALAALAALLSLAQPEPAKAQLAVVVSSCPTTRATPYPVGTQALLTVDVNGTLCTNATGGGGGGGTSSNFSAAFPSAGTAVGMSQGGNMVPFTGTADNLNVNCQVGCSGGSFNNNADNVATSATNGQAAAWNYVWDGSAWDRLYGDSTNGAFVNVKTGSITANAGTNLNTSALALDATLLTTNVNLGPPGATACATDNGSCSLNALLQRNNQRLTTMIAGIPVTNAGTFAVQVNALTSWAGSTLGAMAAYGTSPGAVLVPGVNAFITNATAPITPAAGTANPTTANPVIGFGMVWNGTTWDPLPGTSAGVTVRSPTAANFLVTLPAETTKNIGTVSQLPYPSGATPYTATATGTTGATTATLAGASSVTTYLCGFSIRANATAAATGNATVTGVITATMNFTQWTAPLASGLGITEMIFAPCIPASGTNQSVAVVSAAPGTGGVVSVTAWGYKL